MRYTPVELRHVKMRRALFGYHRDETDRVLDDVADSFEDVWSERGELADKLEEIEKQLADFKQREVLLANTLISAQKAAAEARELAGREAEVILAEAHQEARAITRSALGERERLFAEARRIEALLRSALGAVSESAEPPAERADVETPPAQAAEEEFWPRREDTREFEPVQLARPQVVPQPSEQEPEQPADRSDAPAAEPGPEPLPESASEAVAEATEQAVEPGAAVESDEPTSPPAPLPPAAEEDAVDGPWAGRGRGFAWG